MNQNILNHNKDQENGTINEELFNKSNNTDSLKDSFIKKAVDSYLDEGFGFVRFEAVANYKQYNYWREEYRNEKSTF